MDDKRSPRDCYCGGSVHKNVWLSFHRQLHEGLLDDPGFSGDWVHSLCGVAYPVIFRVLVVDLEDDSFTMHTDCPAGLLAMLVVCTQSAALNHAARQPPQPEGAPPGKVAEVAEGSDDADSGAPLVRASGVWRWTPRVVRNEGASVGDVFGAVGLDECLKQCEARPGCGSLAFGPHGCHLKARCVRAGDELVPEGVQGADYRTYYREPCPAAGESAAEAAPAAGPEQNTPLEESQQMIRFVLRALEFCFHCLDASPWPFLLAEVLENYALSVESPGEFLWQRPAGGLAVPPTAPGGDEAPSLDPPAEGAALPPLRRALLRLRVRWIRGLEMEAEFWRKKLSLDAAENSSPERLRQWLATGDVTWSLEGDDVCAFLRQALRLRAAAASAAPGPAPAWTRGPPRILNAGSGPFAPAPRECPPDPNWPRSSAAGPGRGGSEGGGPGSQPRVSVVAADGMARFYLRVLDEHGLTPLHRPVQCPAEELHACFPSRHFDVVHIRNALDHAFDPLLGVERMLHVLRPGGWLLLRHARNEGVPGKFRNGLHQWAFDVGAGETPPFVIWNPELRVDVTAHLLGTGLAAEVRTELREHPSADAPPDERYVWVDIRKPTEAEAAARGTAF